MQPSENRRGGANLGIECAITRPHVDTLLKFLVMTFGESAVFIIIYCAGLGMFRKTNRRGVDGLPPAE